MTKTSKGKAISLSKFVRHAIFLSGFAVFAILAAFQKGAYDSDGVFFYLFYQDVFQNGGNFFAWKFGPGMSLNLELVIRCVAAFLSKNNIAISAMVDTFLQTVLLFLAMNFLFQELVRCDDVSPEMMEKHPYPFGLFFIALTCMYSGVSLTGIFNYYIPSDITWSFLIIIFFFKYYNTLQNKYLFISSTCLCLAVFGSRKFFFFFAIPLLVSFFLFLVLTANDIRNRKVFAKSLLSSLVAVFAADQILLKIITPNFAGAFSYFEAQTTSLTKINSFIEEIRYLFEQGGYFHIIAVLVFLCALIFLSYHAAKLAFSRSTLFFHLNHDEGRSIEFICAFLAILTMIITWTTILSVFFFTSFRPSQEIRYYSVFRYYSVAYVWLLFFVAFKMSQSKTFSPKNYYMLNCAGFLLVFIVFIAFFFAKEQWKGFPAPLRSVIDYDADIADMANARCIDENKEKYNLNHGIANFWLAQSVTALSKKKIRVNQIGYSTDVLPYYWQNNREWFLTGAPGSGKPLYNFIIFSNIDPDSRGRVVRQRFGKATASFECSEISSITKVLVYPDDTNFDARLKHFWENSPDSVFYKKGRREWLFYATELEINQAIFSMLEFNDTSLSTLENITPPGLLTYGPYLTDLSKGTYQITLNYRINNLSPGEAALKWDILINTEEVIAEGEIVMEKEKCRNFLYRFSLEENPRLFEFRTYLNNSKAKVTLLSLHLKRIFNNNNKNGQQEKR